MKLDLDTVYNMDCLELMSMMSDDSVDTTITSPPYNFNLRLHYGKYEVDLKSKQKYVDGYSDALSMDEYYEWQKKCISEMIRVTKHNVFYNIQIITGNKPAVFRLIGDFHNQIKELIVWDKTKSEPAMATGVLNSEFELIIVFSNQSLGRTFDVAQFPRGTMSNVIRVGKKQKNNNSSVHKAVFPNLIPYTIIKNLTDESHVVFDPFMGVGTVAKAALSLNMRYVGSEINRAFIEEIETNVHRYKNNLFTN